MGGPIKGNIMRGKVNGCDVDILIDSGADYGLVPANIVLPKAYLGQKCWVTGVGDEPVLFELAEAWFDLSGTHVRRKVAVDTRPEPKPWCLLPIDLKNASKADPLLKALRSSNICVMTRSKKKAEQSLEYDIRVNPRPLGSLVKNNSHSDAQDSSNNCDGIVIPVTGDGVTKQQTDEVSSEEEEGRVRRNA